MKICLKCKNEFTGRADKKFCSNKCRNNYNNSLNYIQRLYKVTKKRALFNNIPFNITEEDLVIPENCPVLGIPINRQIGSLSNNSPSIDKIDPALGYIKGNVWIISMRANRMKSDLSREEIIKFCTVLLNKINCRL